MTATTHIRPGELPVPSLAAADPLNLEAQLTQSEKQLRDRVRAFAESEIAPHVQEWWEAESLPRDLIRGMGKLGILGLMHEPGGEQHAIAYGLAGMELEAVDAGPRTLFSVQSSLAMGAIYHFGSPQQ